MRQKRRRSFQTFETSPEQGETMKGRPITDPGSGVEQPELSGQTKYLLQEANLIGSRIQWYLEQHQRIEALGIIGSGAIWAWVFSLKNPDAVAVALWFPVGITVLLFAKSLLFTKTIEEAFNYLYELEQYFGLPPGKGWVHYFRTRSSQFKRRWRIAFWSILLFVNLSIALLISFEVISLNPKSPNPTLSNPPTGII